jgi:uncharacterized glyoxalase superfamily protein PhnB
MPGPSLIPCLIYHDAPGAIDFLCDGFGFERHAVHTDAADPAIVRHAQLRLGDATVMLSSALSEDKRALYRWKTPAEAGGVTVCLYGVVADPDAHCARAKAAGAEIVVGPYDNEGYPGRSYNCRDPEGNDWEFGTYDPQA